MNIIKDYKTFISNVIFCLFVIFLSCNRPHYNLRKIDKDKLNSITISSVNNGNDITITDKSMYAFLKQLSQSTLLKKMENLRSHDDLIRICLNFKDSSNYYFDILHMVDGRIVVTQHDANLFYLNNNLWILIEGIINKRGVSLKYHPS